jgi:uncharacterized damage-inducible protein DinB
MDRALLIEEYSTGGATLGRAVAGMKQDELLAYPVPGTWSIQEIILHLMDSEMVFADRMKRVIAEENATLLAFDETQFAKNLFYNDQSAEDAVTLIDLTRRNLSRVLKKLPAEAFDRIGTHSQRGPLKLSDIIELANKHLKHHLGFIIDKRKKLPVASC